MLMTSTVVKEDRTSSSVEPLTIRENNMEQKYQKPVLKEIEDSCSDDLKTPVKKQRTSVLMLTGP